jgi:hypothetical protein
MFCICAVYVIGHLLVTQHTEIKNLIELMDYGLFYNKIMDCNNACKGFITQSISHNLA